MSTILLYAPAKAHTRANHPENSRRLSDVLAFLDERGALAELERVDSAPATTRQVREVHSSGLLEQIRQVSRAGGGLLDADTYATAASFDLAMLAAGASCRAVDRVMEGRADNGLVLVRPPGHHAEHDRVGGFCLINNVAVAARQAQKGHGARRVLIVDFDVHHGNGTQEIFYEDASILFISVHLYHPFFYPGTGALREMGGGRGHGKTINIPFPPHVGDVGYGRAFNQIIAPCARIFEPDLVIVSAGYDAHWQDPLASASLSLDGYARLSRTLVELANSLCSGRILFILEGGYFVDALHFGILNTIYALTGRDEIADPLGPAPDGERDVSPLLRQLRTLHLLN